MNIWQAKENNQNRANTRYAHAIQTTRGLLTTFTDVIGQMKPMCKEISTRRLILNTPPSAHCKITVLLG